MSARLAKRWGAGRAGVLVLGALLLVAAGCAHRVPLATIEPATVRALYETALARRVQASACALADLDVRLDGARIGKLPRVEMRLALQAPDRLRLRASWLLGTALDVCAQGDSVQAVVPPRHRAFVVGGSPSPIGPPAERLLGALFGLWKPDSAAWSGAVADSGHAHVRWTESGDSLDLAVDGEGRPASLVWRTPDGPRVTVRYLTWASDAGVEMPARVTVEDDRGEVRARFDVSGFDPRREPDPEWFTLTLPERTERVDWPGLARLLRGVGDEW